MSGDVRAARHGGGDRAGRGAERQEPHRQHRLQLQLLRAHHVPGTPASHV